MKRAAALLITVVVLASLTACKEQPTATSVAGYYASRIDLPDGRTVVCVSIQQGVAGAISCDWDTAE